MVAGGRWQVAGFFVLKSVIWFKCVGVQDVKNKTAVCQTWIIVSGRFATLSRRGDPTGNRFESQRDSGNSLGLGDSGDQP